MTMARVLGHDIVEEADAVRSAVSLTGQLASVDEDLTGRDKHVPEQLLDVTITPVMFVLMFSYLFGGAITGPTGDYPQYILPGILVTASRGLMAGTASISDIAIVLAAAASARAVTGEARSGHRVRASRRPAAGRSPGRA